MSSSVPTQNRAKACRHPFHSLPSRPARPPPLGSPDPSGAAAPGPASGAEACGGCSRAGPGLNGSRPARAAPGALGGQRFPGAASPGSDGARPKTRPRRDRPSGVTAARGRVRGGSREAPVTETLLLPDRPGKQGCAGGGGGSPGGHPFPGSPPGTRTLPVTGTACSASPQPLPGDRDAACPPSPYLCAGRSSAAAPPRLCGAERDGTARFPPRRPPPRMRRGTARPRGRTARLGSARRPRGCAPPASSLPPSLPPAAICGRTPGARPRPVPGGHARPRSPGAALRRRCRHPPGTPRAPPEPRPRFSRPPPPLPLPRLTPRAPAAHARAAGRGCPRAPAPGEGGAGGARGLPGAGDVTAGAVEAAGAAPR
ncbi:translation initiation factor IF-2-like [Apus apus]|uniref:translation initiation factor IF-2-like n=1 Tax=Apus apus TaxID=8895 RepID=UPI0021F8748A|nr:translation initiation factor IF-2-like [Apus apus]